MSKATDTAQTLLNCWRNGQAIEQLDSASVPQSVRHGYDSQAELARLRNEPVLGWKIAATAQAGRQHINVEHPLAGRLYTSIVHQTDSTIELNANRMRMAEAEIVLVLGKTIAPRSTPYAADELVGFVSAIAPGLEIPDSRFTDFTKVGAACLLADNACAQHFVLGKPMPVSEDPMHLSEQATSLRINDIQVTQGTGHDALGGPMQALAWIANTLSDLNIALEAGQFVTTGVTGQPSPINPGDKITVDIGSYGQVSTQVK